MTSFRLGIKPTRRAAARFVAKARRTLQQAVVRAAEDGITQSDVAREIGVHRSLISRELNGEANISLGRFAEIAHALGGEPEIDIVFPADQAGRNAPAKPARTTTGALDELRRGEGQVPNQVSPVRWHSLEQNGDAVMVRVFS